jgi:adenosylhomocysteine nucleosidase
VQIASGRRSCKSWLLSIAVKKRPAEIMAERIVGIMGAMPEEIREVADLLEGRDEVSYGMRTYYTGTLNGIKAVVVFSRWGKVAAATTVSNLILAFKVTELVFIGVAGAIQDNLSIGDIVIAKRLIQHDMDARPLMKRYEIPLLELTWFEADDHLADAASNAIDRLLSGNKLSALIGSQVMTEFGITAPKLLQGDIASGDQFFALQSAKDDLRSALPETLCVEMEGAAVAQVCYEYGIPFLVIRTISDDSNENSHKDFPAFIAKVASKYSVAMIRELFEVI